MGSTPPGETRAEIARRRLAELAAAFDAAPPADDETGPESGQFDTTERAQFFESARRVTVTHLRAVGTGAAVLLLIAAWWLLQSRPEEAPLSDASSAQALKSSTTEVTEEPAEVVIDVAGKVRRPGIVVLPIGSRVHDAIEAAGGTKGKVDLSDLNLARVLTDGEQIRVGITEPAAQATASPIGSVPSQNAGGGLININTASSAELETLPGVGPVTAGAIIDWRTRNGAFRTVDDLIDVRGIGEATLERLRDLVQV